MKTLLLVVSLAVGVSAVLAADSVLPEFNSTTSGLPPLSLNDIAKGGATPSPRSFGLIEPRPTLPAPVRSRVTRDSGMPTLQPDPKVDYKMIVQAPDPATDFKLIVKTPGAPAAPIEPAK